MNHAQMKSWLPTVKATIVGMADPDILGAGEGQNAAGAPVIHVFVRVTNAVAQGELEARLRTLGVPADLPLEYTRTGGVSPG